MPQWGVVFLVLVGEVFESHKLDNFGPRFCPQGPQMSVPHGTSSGGTGTLNDIFLLLGVLLWGVLPLHQSNL